MGNPERPRWAHFASSGSQSEHRIRFFMPTCGFNHIMQQCGIVNQLLHSNKEAYYSTFIQDNSNDPKCLFKTVNMPLHRNSEACYPQASNDAQLANAFADFFVQKIERIRGEIARGCSASGMTTTPTAVNCSLSSSCV